MESVNISLDTIEKVKGFVNIISTFGGDFDLVSGRYAVDAKSIMGIFSLDLGKPMRLDIHDAADAPKVLALVKDYIV